MKKGGDHHVFGDREPGVPNFTHYQGCNSQKMGHVWNVGSLAVFDVDVTRILDRAGEPARQVELPTLIIVRTLLSCLHNASIQELSSLVGFFPDESRKPRAGISIRPHLLLAGLRLLPL